MTRERNEREADGLSRTPEVAEAPEQTHAEEKRESDDEVPDEAVEPAGDERPDREQDRVVLGLVGTSAAVGVARTAAMPAIQMTSRSGSERAATSSSSPLGARRRPGAG